MQRNAGRRINIMTGVKNEFSREIPQFSGANVPVIMAAKIMKKDQQFIRQGMIQGILPFGTAYKKNGSTHYDYYISPKAFWEYTGYVYNPEAD